MSVLSILCFKLKYENDYVARRYTHLIQWYQKPDILKPSCTYVSKSLTINPAYVLRI